MGDNNAVKQVLAERTDEVTKQTPEETTTQRSEVQPDISSDYIIAAAAVEVPELEEDARKLLLACHKHMKKTGTVSAFSAAMLKPYLKAAYGTTKAVVPDPGLLHWTPGMVLSIGATNELSAWAGDGNSVAQVVKQGYSHVDHLNFNYPLTGKFEISVKTASDGVRGMTMCYGGLAIMSDYNRQKSVYVNSMTGAGSQGTAQLTVDRNKDFDTWKIVSDGTQAEYFFNGASVFVDKAPAKTSPWLQLHGASYGGGPVAAKEISISGSPEIPQQVELLQGDSMEGWSSIFYYELTTSQNASRFDGRVTIHTYNYGDEIPQPWSVKDGVLTGETSDKTEYSKFSWLNYHRSLLNGEKLDYEFFYRKGEKVVHPAIGRTAFVLQADGIQLHWMNSSNFQGRAQGANSGFDDDNQFDVPEYRKGPAALPLKDADWNKVTLERLEEVISVSLNGTKVYEYPLDEEDLTNIGFFRNRTTDAVEIKNVVLSGNWPKTLTTEMLEQLFAQKPDLTPEQLAAQKKMMDLAAE